MPKKPLETLSEPMFYVLMALRRRSLCGADIVTWVSRQTDRRVALGPGTLYTILPKLTEEGILKDAGTDGRKRAYQMTEKGRTLYDAECRRLRQVVLDIEREEKAEPSPFELGKEA